MVVVMHGPLPMGIVRSWCVVLYSNEIYDWEKTKKNFDAKIAADGCNH